MSSTLSFCVVSVKQNPGLLTRGNSLQGGLEVEGVYRLELTNWIETNVSHGAGIDEVVGQQAVILVGTEQAVRRTDDGFGEAFLVLRVHDVCSLRAWVYVPS